MPTRQEVLEEQHHVDITVKVVIPEGLYIPIPNPLTEDERTLADAPALCAGVEAMHYIREALEGIGVVIEQVRVNDSYTLQTIIRR